MNEDVILLLKMVIFQCYVGLLENNLIPPYTWMSQEFSNRLGSVGYNPNIPHVQVGEITH